MIILIQAENTYQDLKNREHGNDIKLRLPGLVVEKAHTQKSAERAAEPGPEEEGALGDAAGVLFRTRLIVAVQDERGEVDQDEPVNEDHAGLCFQGRDDAQLFAGFFDDVEVVGGAEDNEDGIALVV